MARKKKLEKEFAERVKAHKFYVIMYNLVETGDKVYNNKYLKRYKSMKSEPYEYNGKNYSSEEVKALDVTIDLEDRAEKGEQELYDQIYEYCWKKVKKTIGDTDTPEQHGLKK